MTEHHTLADRLRARSDQLGLAPAHVAEMAGVNRSFVYDILRGRSSRPSIDRLAEVARAPLAELWQWAFSNWSIAAVPRRRQAVADGMRPLRLAGAARVAEGLTTLDEVLACTPSVNG